MLLPAMMSTQQNNIESAATESDHDPLTISSCPLCMMNPGPMICDRTPANKKTALSGSGAMVADNCCILPGMTLGENALLGSGSIGPFPPSQLYESRSSLDTAGKRPPRFSAAPPSPSAR